MMFLYKSRMWPKQKPFYAMKNQFRFRYTWKIHDNWMSKKNTRNLLSFIHSNIVGDFQQPNRNAQTFWSHIEFILLLLLILLIWNQLATWTWPTNWCVCVCALVSISIWMLCVMYEHLFCVILSLFLFEIFDAKPNMLRRCDGTEWNEANVPHYWYWYGINRVKLTSRRPICSARELSTNVTKHSIAPHHMSFILLWPQNTRTASSFASCHSL